MTRLEALAALLQIPRPCPAVTFGGRDVSAVWFLALAERSGMLGDCRTAEQLADAVEHGQRLLTAGVVTGDDINADTLTILDEIAAWVDCFEELKGRLVCSKSSDAWLTRN